MNTVSDSNLHEQRFWGFFASLIVISALTSLICASLLFPTKAYALFANKASMQSEFTFKVEPYAAEYEPDMLIFGCGSPLPTLNGKQLVATFRDFYATSDVPDNCGAATDTVPWHKGPLNKGAITTVKVLDPIQPSSVLMWFNDFSTLTNIDLTLLDTSLCTSFNRVFNGCYAMDDYSSITNWNTARVTDFRGCFTRNFATRSLDLSGWNTSSAQTFYDMFYLCESVESINTTGWNTSNVEIMRGVFANCYNLKSIPGIETWNTSRSQIFGSMFERCGKLTSLNLGSWNVSGATQFWCMFQYCSSLTSLGNIQYWNTRNAINMYNMFLDCSSLNANLTGWNVGEVWNRGNFNSGAPGVRAPSFSA